MASELWLLNPHNRSYKLRGRPRTKAGSRRRSKRVRKLHPEWFEKKARYNSMNPRRRRRRSKRRMSAKQRQYFGKRRTRSYAANPKRRRRRRARSIFGNPRRRSYRRRGRSHRYRYNPPAVRSIASELGWGAAGFMTTKIVGNMATPMIVGITGTSDVARIGVKVLVAYLSAWGLSSFMGQRVFMPAMLGGSIEAIQDAVKTFIAPTFPALAENYEPLELYYEPRRMLPRGMGEYMGDGLSPDHDVVV